MFEKILIANRGEIALRIHRACKEMGIKTVAVHSTADESAMHVRLADEAVCIGEPPARSSYLNMANIISAGLLAGADAIHPGIGFLSENAKFAQMIEEHNMAFIGPTAEHINIMGDKVTAKKTMIDLGVPCVPGSDGAIADLDEAIAVTKETGFPVIIKAASGGGGKGMKIAHSEAELRDAIRLAKSEAQANFGDAEVYMEKFLTQPRHIEIQIVADGQGGVIHLGERDCSIQRRHQKVIEEAPSPALNEKMRQKIFDISTSAMKKLGYKSVGTLEFLYENGEFYFIEMNTRLQVEHCVSEMLTGIDLVREQIRIASGRKLSYQQSDIQFTGHAIESRVNAENPDSFLPRPGKITDYHAPGGLGVRVDSALYSGYSIPPYYDSLISKLVVHGANRNECLMRLRRALDEYVISGEGIETNIPLHQKIIASSDFIDGNYDIHWLEENLLKPKSAKSKDSNEEKKEAA